MKARSYGKQSGSFAESRISSLRQWEAFVHRPLARDAAAKRAEASRLEPFPHTPEASDTSV